MSSRTEVLTIEKTLPSERLDTFLRGKFPAVSRGAIQRLIEEGHIHVNGRKVLTPALFYELMGQARGDIVLTLLKFDGGFEQVTLKTP